MVWFGIAGLAVTFIIGLVIACPTIGQQDHLRKLMAICAGAFGAGIPGMLALKFELPGGKNSVRASGGLALLLLVYWCEPAALGNSRVESTFRNAICQGIPPTQVAVPRSSVPEVGESGPIRSINPKDAAGRPTRFWFYYPHGELKGIRTWTQVRPGVWTEVYPDPNFITVFTERGRATVNSCEGSLVRRADEVLTIFIPDTNCKQRQLYFNTNTDAQWHPLGLMRDEG